jgi:hypothetical protein
MDKTEILSLTNEQIETLIDYECALGGVPLLPIKPVKPDDYKPKPDLTVYTVGEYTFKTAEEAGRVLEFLQAFTLYKTEYIHGSGLTKRLIPTNDYSKPKVEIVEVFSPEHWDKVKSDHVKYESENSKYEADMKEYNNACSGRSDIAEGVWEVVNNARNEQRNKERLTAEFNRYLGLADGNTTIAMRFLVKAHQVPEELAEELCPGFNPQRVVSDAC